MIVVSSESQYRPVFTAAYATQYAAATVVSLLLGVAGLMFHRWMVGHYEADPEIVFMLLLSTGVVFYLATEKKVPPYSGRNAICWTIIGLATCGLLTWLLHSMFQQ